VLFYLSLKSILSPFFFIFFIFLFYFPIKFKHKKKFFENFNLLKKKKKSSKRLILIENLDNNYFYLNHLLQSKYINVVINK